MVGSRAMPHAIRLVISAPDSHEQRALASQRLEHLIAIEPRQSAMSG